MARAATPIADARAAAGPDEITTPAWRTTRALQCSERRLLLFFAAGLIFLGRLVEGESCLQLIERLVDRVLGVLLVAAKLVQRVLQLVFGLLEIFDRPVNLRVALFGRVFLLRRRRGGRGATVRGEKGGSTAGHGAHERRGHKSC